MSIDRFYFHHRQGATSSYGPADLSNHHGQQPVIKDEPVDVTQPESGGYFNHQYQHGGGYYPPFHHHHQAADYQTQRARDCLYQQPHQVHRPAISPSPSPTSNYATVSSSGGFVHPPTAYPSYGSTHHHPSQSQASLIGPHHPRNFTVHPFHRHPKLSVSTPPSSPQVTTSDVLNMHHHHHHMIQHPTVQQPHYPAIQTSSTAASNACQPPPIKVKRGKSPIRLTIFLFFGERAGC